LRYTRSLIGLYPYLWHPQSLRTPRIGCNGFWSHLRLLDDDVWGSSNTLLGLAFLAYQAILLQECLTSTIFLEIYGSLDFTHTLESLTTLKYTLASHSHSSMCLVAIIEHHSVNNHHILDRQPTTITLLAILTITFRLTDGPISDYFGGLSIISVPTTGIGLVMLDHISVYSTEIG
jgi:hypothetical protein